ncbi:MAG: hypothetical protein N3C12_00440 [Candidatus Binatia bacterium]|nr:hypothetical protein [Candidatus Binatia bacterium]
MVLQAAPDGVALLTWRMETFAYAESFDATAGRYRGLRGGQHVVLGTESAGLLVKPDVAQRQLEAESSRARLGPAGEMSQKTHGEATPAQGTTVTPAGGAAPAAPRPRRFHGTIELDPARVGRDASRIADEVIAHLVAQVGARAKVVLEISATLPDGSPQQLVRVVTENSRTLRFTSHGFEEE